MAEGLEQNGNAMEAISAVDSIWVGFEFLVDGAVVDVEDFCSEHVNAAVLLVVSRSLPLETFVDSSKFEFVFVF